MILWWMLTGAVLGVIYVMVTSVIQQPKMVAVTLLRDSYPVATHTVSSEDVQKNLNQRGCGNFFTIEDIESAQGIYIDEKSGTNDFTCEMSFDGGNYVKRYDNTKVGRDNGVKYRNNQEDDRRY